MTSDSSETYDVIIVGAGPAGEHGADRCRRAGLTTALVEQELAGGECSYWACIPSKTLLRPTQVLAQARKVPGAREAIHGDVDVVAALARRDYMVSDWHDDGQAQWIESVGASLFRGHGRLTAARTVTVESASATTVLRANRAVILATGSSAAIPPIEGIATTRWWDNRGVTSAEQVPDSLVVIGGGAVGVEMAQAWHRLGCPNVTIIEGGERLIANTEPFAGDLLRDAFENEGIDVVTGAAVVSVHRDSDEAPVDVRLKDGRSIVASELLVAVGRRPRTIDLGLETVGLDPGRYVPVDDSMRVSSVDGDWLYAVGDINGRALLTHIGKYQARVAVGSILGRDVTAETDRDAIPSVIFTDPMIASVGLTERAARERSLDVHTVQVATNSVAAAPILGETVLGSCQFVIDKSQHVIVGATFTGPDIADALHAATIAIVGRVPLPRLFHAVPSFPTLSEVWLDLVESYLATMPTDL